jgi:hypothetical protein
LPSVDALQAAVERLGLRNARLREENAQLRIELNGTKQALAEERARLSMLWDYCDELTDGGELVPYAAFLEARNSRPPAGERKPRRTKVDGETGIYETSWGALEVVYRAGGKQCYETVEGGVEEARVLRALRVAEASAATHA